MHPIINDFINTGEALPAIVERYYDKNQFLENVFYQLGKNFYKYDSGSQLMLDLDQAIVKGHPDTRLYFLFISFATIFTSNRSELDRARVLMSIGSSIIRDQFHPIEQAYFFHSMAFLKLFSGKKIECKAFVQESLSLIDNNSPRFLRILGNLAHMLADQGELKTLKKEYLDLLDSSSKDEILDYIFVELKLKNCIFTGNYKEGFALLEKYKIKNTVSSTDLMLICTNLLKIQSGDFDEKNYQDEFFRLYAKTCYHLALGEMDEAIKFSNLFQVGTYHNKFRMEFRKYFPLHIELSLRNKGMARLLYQELLQKEGPHYLDDFFLARLQLLESNRAEAFETFHRLIENIKKYGAMNRLIFELQFAKEMKPSDILLLSSGIIQEENQIIPQNLKDKSTIENKIKNGTKLLIGDSPVISQIKELVQRFAKLKDPVLIAGETGTGKELVSRAIHEEGPHPKEPFLAINCGALTESLLQSELFGYEAGAFTGAQKEHQGIFEAAGRGTVFLDEFGDISPQMQVSLLRVLESNEIRLIGGTKTRQIKCKIVIATNTNLKQAVESKKFREDLYFRLTRFDIKLSPLRERKEDIPELINFFLNNGSDKNAKKLSNNLLEKLISYQWPGNIRELKNEIERLKILHADKEILDLEDFDFSRLQGLENKYSKQDHRENEKHLANLKLEKQDGPYEKRIISIIERGSKADQRIDFLKGLFKQFKKLTRLQVIEIMKVSPVTAAKDLNFLCKAGLIVKITPTKSVKSYYFELAE